MSYLLSILIILSFLFIGRIFSVKIFRKNLPWALNFFLGIGVLGIWSQILLILGIYQKIYLVFFILACYFYWFTTHKNELTFKNIKNTFYLTKLQTKKFINEHDHCLIGSLLITVLILFFLNCVPITTGDAINYHFPFIKNFILTRHINYPLGGVTQWGLGYLPAMAEIIFASFVLLTGAVQLTAPLILFQASILVAFLALFYDVTEIFIKRKSLRLLVPLLLLTMPEIWFVILFVGMTDLLLCPFLVSGLFVFYKWTIEKENTYLYLAAFFLGVALAMKYMTLLILGPCFLIYLVQLLTKKNNKLFIPTLYSIGIILFISSYWYVKNALIVHNPIYPIFSSAGLNEQIARENLLPQIWWVNLLYPVLVYAPFLFSPLASRLSIVEFVAVIFAIIGSLIIFLRSKRQETISLHLVAFALFYSWLAATVQGSIRYNLPALLLFLVAIAIIIDRLIDQFPKITEKIWLRLIIATFIPVLILNLSIYKKRLPIIFHPADRDIYVRKELKNSYSMERYHALINFTTDP